MKIFNRIIPALSAIIIFVLLEKIFQAPKQIFWITFIAVIFSILSIWQLTDRKLLSRKFWQFIITPVLLLTSGILFLSFLEGIIIRQIFLVILVGAIWTYLEVIYLWLHFRPKYQPHSLENISTHLNLLTIFLTASGLYSLIIFFGLSLWALIIIFAIISLLLTHQMVWVSGATFKSEWPYVLVISFAVLQVFVVVSFLPTSIYVNGLLVTLIYYVMTGISRNWLLDIKDKKVIQRYLIISSVFFILILLTAKWF